MSLAARAGLLAALLVAEKFLLNFFVDFDRIGRASGFIAAARVAQHVGFRFLVAFGIAVAVFTYAQADARLIALNQSARSAPIRVGWACLHGAILPILALLSYSLAGGRGLELPFAVCAGLWVMFAAAAVIAAAAALAPGPIWRDAARAIGSLWLYGGLAAAVGAGVLYWSQELWSESARFTFGIVAKILTPLVPSLQADSHNLILSTNRISVQIADVCSGLEGVGLMLAFCAAWLLCFRREFRFPRAFVLLPAGALVIYALNILRVAALLLIGHAGYPAVAEYGFHSQAGWIAFNVAAGLVVILSRRSAWLARAAPPSTGASADARPDGRTEITSDNPTAAYLLPFLSILAAGMLARAGSSGFEWLYPLRLIVGAALLRWYWPRLAALNWRCSWRGALAGVVVFLLWLIGAHFFATPAAMPAALVAATPVARVSWITCRAIAAIVTVPIAEELAYRGFLMRRLQAREFEHAPFAAVRWPALLVSAIVFGIGHGALWLPGIAAGLVYGLVLVRTERIGEAVIAHAVTNALVTASVLLVGAWQLW